MRGRARGVEKVELGESGMEREKVRSRAGGREDQKLAGSRWQRKDNERIRRHRITQE